MNETTDDNVHQKEIIGCGGLGDGGLGGNQGNQVPFGAGVLMMIATMLAALVKAIPAEHANDNSEVINAIRSAKTAVANAVEHLAYRMDREIVTGD